MCPQVKRLGDVDAVSDPKIKGLFKNVRSEGQDAAASSPPKDGPPQHHDLVIATAEKAVGEGAAAARGKTLLVALVLAQIETCAKRLKTDLALLSPHCVEATGETFALINKLLTAHPLSSVSRGAGGNADDSCESYVPLALIRVLTINLRQASRHAACFMPPAPAAGSKLGDRFELGAELLTDLRSVLLRFVGDSHEGGEADEMLMAKAQEGAVSALRAGTPVLFNDAAQLVGLLDVMLQKHSDRVASPSEEQFMAMLLSYLAKPPVIWRVLTLAQQGGHKEEGTKACMLLFSCLLGHLLAHSRAVLSGAEHIPREFSKACIEVLATAWRLMHSVWTNAAEGRDKEEAQELSVKVTVLFFDHCLDLTMLVSKALEEDPARGSSVVEECLQSSAVGTLLHDFLVVASQLATEIDVLMRMTDLLAALDAVASSLPGVAVATLSLGERGGVGGQADVALGLQSQKVVGQCVSESEHPLSAAGAAWGGERRDVVSLPGSTYLLVDFSERCCTSGKGEWVQVEDGFGTFLAGRFSGGSGWPQTPVVVPGETCVIVSGRRHGVEAGEGGAFGYMAKVTGYLAPMFSIDTWEVTSGQWGGEAAGGSVPLFLTGSVIYTQVSFDPRGGDAASPGEAQCPQRCTVRMGSEVFDYAAGCLLGDDGEGGFSQGAGFPAAPLATVNPNILFTFAAEAGANGEESEEGGARSPIPWRATVCCITLAGTTDSHWLVEVLRLASCVSAQLAGSLVVGGTQRESEVMCSQWLASDLLKMGQLGTHEAELYASYDATEEALNLPGKPHPLRQHPALDRLERAVTGAMLHHLNLLNTVRAHGDETWGDEAAGLIPILRKVGVSANKVRRIVMQRRDQLLSLSSASDTGSAASGPQVASYDELCQGTLDRALLLLKFVPAYGRQDNPKSPAKPVRAARAASAAAAAAVSAGGGELSPSQKWQRAALKIVGELSPVKRRLAVEIDSDAGSCGSAVLRQGEGRVASAASVATSVGDSEDSEAASPWMNLLGFFKVHHAYWRVKSRTVKHDEMVVEMVLRFVTSEITAELLGESMETREVRAREVEAGLTCLTRLFKRMQTRVGRAEVLQALLVSNWATRHYLEDIRASSATSLGRVRALFNDVCRSLLDVLRSDSSSCQMRGYAANSLAMMYDGADLEYLALIGLPGVLGEFVGSEGASLQLGAFERDCHGAASARQIPSTAGVTWHGVSLEDGEEREMSLCLLVHKQGVSGTGCGSAGNFVVKGELGDGDNVHLETVSQDGSKASFKGHVTGKRMEGMWVRGLEVGNFSLHRTMRTPMHSSALSRVNRSYIRFAGREVVFTGTNQIGVVQADKPLTAERPYFEVQVLDKGRDCAIAVGVAHRDYPLDQMPGWRLGSIAYHMDDGKLFFQRGQGALFGDKCGQGDVVGCGIELSEKGDSVVSVYWTKNGELVGRELCASSLQLPLYASVALHSQGERVLIFEAPPPPSLSKDALEYVNSNGHPVRLGTDRSFTHLYYCAQRIGVGRLPGSDGTCGPNNGPQCPSCEMFQEQVSSKAAEQAPCGEEGGDARDGDEAQGEIVQVDLGAQQALASQAVWRLLRVLLLQATEKAASVNGKLAVGLWDTVLGAIRSLARQAGRPHVHAEEPGSAIVTVTGRQAYDEDKLSVSSSNSEVGNLESPDATLSWTSACVGRRTKHWLQFGMKSAVALTYLGVLVSKEDGDLCPGDVQVFAGEDEARLRQISELRLEVGDMKEGPGEIALLSEPEEAFQMYRVCLEGGGGNVRVRGLVVRGVVVQDQFSCGEQEETCIARRVEVSTNKCAKRFLSDGRSDTFWQSDGRSGQHWIRLHVEPDAVVTGLAIQVHSGDGNYCPSLVDVLVGDTPVNIKRIRTISVSPSGNQRCVLLDKVKASYRIVQVCSPTP